MASSLLVSRFVLSAGHLDGCVRVPVDLSASVHPCQQSGWGDRSSVSCFNTRPDTTSWTRLQTSHGVIKVSHVILGFPKAFTFRILSPWSISVTAHDCPESEGNR